MRLVRRALHGKKEPVALPLQMNGRGAGLRAVRQDAVMDPGQMRDVEEVLDGPGGRAVPGALVPNHLGETVVLQHGKLGNLRSRRFRQADPDHAVTLLRGISRQAGLLRDGVFGRDRGNPRAPARPVVRPSVVRADELAAFHPTQRDGRPPMNAEVAEGRRLTVEPTNRQPLPQQPDGQGPVRQLLRQGHRVPVPPQRGPEIPFVHYFRNLRATNALPENCGGNRPVLRIV